MPCGVYRPFLVVRPLSGPTWFFQKRTMAAQPAPTGTSQWAGTSTSGAGDFPVMDQKASPGHGCY